MTRRLALPLLLAVGLTGCGTNTKTVVRTVTSTPAATTESPAVHWTPTQREVAEDACHTLAARLTGEGAEGSGCECIVAHMETAGEEPDEAVKALDEAEARIETYQEECAG